APCRRSSAPPAAIRATPSRASGTTSGSVVVDGRFCTPATAPGVVVPFAAACEGTCCGAVCTPATAAFVPAFAAALIAAPAARAALACVSISAPEFAALFAVVTELLFVPVVLPAVGGVAHRTQKTLCLPAPMPVFTVSL